MFAKRRSKTNRRRYIRLDSVFPVQFQLVTLDGESPLSDMMQGFTSNISKGGICLEVNNLSLNLVNLLKNQEAKLFLKIDVPFGGLMQGSAMVIWVKKVTVNKKNKYLLGLDYDKVNAAQCKKIVRYAWTKKIIIPSLSAAIILLGIGVALNSYTNMRLLRGNKDLVKQLVRILQEFSIAKQEIKYINKEKKNLQLKIEASDLAIQALKEEKAGIEFGSYEAEKVKDLGLRMEEAVQKKNLLLEELSVLQNKENNLTEELLKLDKKKATLGKDNLDNIYQWLKIHQNSKTGLVAKPGADKKSRALAFTDEQALMIQVYTNFADLSRAKRILEFFFKKEKTGEKGFYSVYDADTGLPAESAGVHSRPDIKLGIAIMQYTCRTGNSKYFALAERIAGEVMAEEPSAGADTDEFFSEKKIEAYSLLNMLYKYTGEKKYSDVADKILSHLASLGDERFEKRAGFLGVDVSALTGQILVVGPENMEKLHINPDRMIEIIEENFSQKVNYLKTKGKSIVIKGIDFFPVRQGRNKAVFSEATAKVILALRGMAEFYYKRELIAKARSYELKADEYLVSLGNMVLSETAPSGEEISHLPYAVFDGSSMSAKPEREISATVYALFAYYNYNPLELKD